MHANAAGSTTSPKKIFLDYNLLGQVTDVKRESWTGSSYTLVADSKYTYDQAGRLTELKHTNGGTNFGEFDYLYDLASQITRVTSKEHPRRRMHSALMLFLAIRAAEAFYAS